ncbi:crotonase/enoyl-CoA hydratase family protein [Phenylobacterium sp.]|uniref:crotonase/enoyl-CoA hydratase family protein n=1 Tax=Phenylobacterium sp. TaxID=1871053 RepID=UPI0025EC441A|nr:crotonase/enoyl-CoA hydratase family protein [Phenylobacterium sp.]
MSAAPQVIVSRQGPVTTIMLNRPQRRNAVDGATAILLREAFQAFEADDAASVAVLCGQGEHFCAGYDLKALAEVGIPYEPEGVGPMGPSRMLLTKPAIAAVEGYAVAGGLELALWCDLRVASATAVFGVYCRRWGVPLIDGGTVRLPRLIGHSRALDMVLTGRAVDAEEAHAFGLANRLVEAGQARAAAEALAQEIARFPQICLRADRASTYHQWSAPLADALAFEGREGERPLLSEAQHGAARFSGGRGRAGDFSEI